MPPKNKNKQKTQTPQEHCHTWYYKLNCNDLPNVTQDHGVKSYISYSLNQMVAHYVAQ